MYRNGTRIAVTSNTYATIVDTTLGGYLVVMDDGSYDVLAPEQIIVLGGS
jgi:hypothetical protein